MHSSSRNGAKVIWLGVHTTEGMMRVKDLRDWKAWAGSSHASSDETGALWGPEQGFVPYSQAAWTLRNANPFSENIEQCGWARWTRAEWLARPNLLDATARWLAERSAARGIPLVRLSAADIRARRPGVLGHGDYSAATGDGTHSDPGPNYPWDVVLAKANAYRNGTTTEDDMDVWDLVNFRPVNGQNIWDALKQIQANQSAQGAAITALQQSVAKAGGTSAPIDVAVLRPLILEAVAAGMAADNDAQAEEIVDRLAQRLATPSS